MAYRIETNKTTEEMMQNFQKFLLNPVTIDRVDYSSSVGNGNIENIDFNSSTVVTESWTLQCTDDTNFIFSVTGSVSGSQADAQLDTLYDNGIISFTIRQGSQTWVNGDIVVIYVQKGSTPPFEKQSIVTTAYRTNAFIEGDTSHSLQLRTGVSTAGITAPSKSLTAFRCTYNQYTNYNSYYYYYRTASIRIYDFYETGTDGDRHARLSSLGQSYINTDSDSTVNVWVQSLTERNNLFSVYSRNGDISNDQGAFIIPPFTGYQAEFSRGGFGIGIMNGKLIVQTRAGSSSYNGYRYVYNYILDNDFTKHFMDTVSDPHDWNMLTFVIDRAATSLTLYINGTEIGTYTHSYLGYDFMPSIVAFYGGVAGLMSWKRKLSSGEITNMYNDRSYDNVMSGAWLGIGAVASHQENDLVMKNQKHGFFHLSLTNHHMISLRYEKAWQWGYSRLDSEVPTENSCNIKNGLLSNTNSNYGSSESINFNSPSAYVIGRDFGEIIEKYWFVSDGDSAVLAFKIYDPSTTQTEPVYQMLYMGKTEGTKYHDLPVMIGTRNGYDVWTSTSSYFLFGLQYDKNLVAFLGYFYSDNGYVKENTWTDTSNGVYGNFYRGQPTYWAKVKSVNNQYPLTKIPIYIYSYYNYWDDARSYQQPLGFIKFIYQASTDNIQPEDEILIDGTKYVILKDTYRNTADSMYALKLEE